jgi:alanine racemase
MTADAAPVARVSVAAIVANVRRAAASAPLVDLRHDAYGHGLDAVATALLFETDATLLVDGATTFGDRVVRVGAPSVSPAVTYGWVAGVPAMTLVGTVLSTKRLLAGEGVSYGYRFRAPADTRVALVTGGYAQGVVRGAGGAASVFIEGARHPIVGRVAMDVCVIDIGDADVARGAEATFFGRGGDTVARWAAATGLRSSEIVTAVGLHTRREVQS